MSRPASKLAIALILGTLTGCFPYVMSYVYLDSPGVNYLHFPCRDGAPVGVMYQRNEVRFEVTLEPHGLSPLKDAFLRIRAPRHVVISIPNPIARITYLGTEQGKSMSVQLKSTPLDWQGPYVAAARQRSPLAEYLFVFADLPPITSPGTLELPVVFVGGIAVESPLFTFERRPYAGMPPLNC